MNGVSNNLFGNSTQQSTNQSAQPFLGINMRGYYTSMPQLREDFKSPFPNNYYESSFEIISKEGEQVFQFIYSIMRYYMHRTVAHQSQKQLKHGGLIGGTML